MGTKNNTHQILTITVFILWFSLVEIKATEYYVSPSGNDSNSGTSAQAAWRTIDRINTMDLNPGDNVLFEAGNDYPGNLLLTAEDAGTPTQPVVIGSYGSGRAQIKAGNGSGVTVRNIGGIEIKDLIVMGDDYKTNVGSGIKIVNELPNNQKLEYIRVQNIEASGFGRKKYSAPEVYPMPNGCGIFMGGNASDKSKSGFKNVRITNCVTYKNEYFGIYTSGYWQDDPNTYANSDVYVGYCRMYDNPGDPNYLKNHSGSGILMEDVDGGIIEYCEAYNNGYDCFNHAGPCGIWAAVVNRVIIQYCESHHNHRSGSGDGDGFDFDGGTTNSVMQYNYSHDNDGPGYLICSYKNAPHTYNHNVVRYNLSINDCRKGPGGGICFWSGSPEEDPIYDTHIYGNTIYSSSGPAIAFWQQKGIHNIKIFNNLFVVANNQNLVAGNPDKSMAIFACNAYWSVDGKYDIAGYKSLEEWQKATDQEMLNGKPVGIVVDPKLIDIGNNVTVGDPTKLHMLTAYQLQKDSPLIDAGIDLRSQIGINPGNRDFYGNLIPSGKSFDIGAHEIPLEPQE